ncbi:hypothetical protein [Yoonia vestfoldensis]|uniref:hypothetical protein n=1 Tax=Yoonia vestfoldensis TaxID=245188 RepID=UPI0003789696|nr:hypothetical protein [Yoonia vestfoldensis]
MTRLILAFALCAAFAAPATAFSVSFSLPTLTYPPAPVPDVAQSCGGLVTPLVDTCAAPAK